MSALFLLGLLGSAHCLGMCSAFVVCLGSRRSLTYQMGRLMAYALLGALLGTAGMSARLLWAQHGGRLVLGAAGLVMMGLGWGLLRGGELFRGGKMAGALARMLARPGHGAAFGLGWLTGFLPCGLLFAALARSCAAVSPLQGALLMSSFWLGTAPALLGASYLAPLLRRRLPLWWPRVAAFAVIVLGLVTMVHAVMPPHFCLHCL